MTRTCLISEVFDCHATLCAKLHEALADMPAQVPVDPFISVERSLTLPATAYRLRTTFEECFVIMQAKSEGRNGGDRTLQSSSVIIVFRRREDAAQHECVEDLGRGVTEIAFEDMGEACAFRCDSMKIAMEIVLATDSQRRGPGREWHGEYQMWLDSEDADPNDVYAQLYLVA